MALSCLCMQKVHTSISRRTVPWSATFRVILGCSVWRLHVRLMLTAFGLVGLVGLVTAAPGPGDVFRGADEEQEGSADEKLK